MNIEKRKGDTKIMRYEVRLVDYLRKENKVYPPILETESKKEAFGFMAEVKRRQNKEPYNEYDEVRAYENGVWIANMRLY